MTQPHNDISQCPRCKGSGLWGYVHGQHMPCPDCEGTGLDHSRVSPRTDAVNSARGPGTHEPSPETFEDAFQTISDDVHDGYCSNIACSSEHKALVRLLAAYRRALRLELTNIINNKTTAQERLDELWKEEENEVS